MRSLEQTLSAVLLASAREQPPVPAAWRAEMERMAERSRERYRGLVYESPDFPRFFEQATPIAELTSLNIGSRPSKRAAGGIEALRAIPWVFAWTQNRLLLPSWYGAGAALAEGDAALQREMLGGWPFFQSLLSTLEMALYKTDLGVAERYLRLVEPELRDRFWPDIAREHDLRRRAAARDHGRGRAARRLARRCSGGSRTATRGSTRSRTSRSSCSPARARGRPTRGTRCWPRSPGSPRACATRAEAAASDPRAPRGPAALRTRVVTRADARCVPWTAWIAPHLLPAGELLLTGALLSLYVGLRGGAWAVGTLERRGRAADGAAHRGS